MDADNKTSKIKDKQNLGHPLIVSPGLQRVVERKGNPPLQEVLGLKHQGQVEEDCVVLGDGEIVHHDPAREVDGELRDERRARARIKNHIQNHRIHASTRTRPLVHPR